MEIEGKKLSESQKKAINTTGDNICVNAGAGSGKTKIKKGAQASIDASKKAAEVSMDAGIKAKDQSIKFGKK